MKSKYINSFETTSEYDSYIESAYPEFPNVAYLEDTGKVKYVRTSPNNHLIYGTVAEGTSEVNLYINYQDVPCTVDSAEETFYLDEYNDTVTSIQFNVLGNIVTSIKKIKLDTSNVTNMTNMFSGCRSLTSLDLSGLDTSNVTNMTTMFNNCASLTSLDLSGLNTSNVTNMNSMFSSCTLLTSLNLSGLDTSNVTNMAGMFSSCRSLTSLNLSGLDTSNVTNMNNMFGTCTSLTSLDLSGLDISNVTNMDFMFDWTNVLRDIYITVESTLMKLTNNLSSAGTSYIPSSATIHYNNDNYVWNGSAWTKQ